MKKVIIAYVPVLHEGYRRLFERHKDAEVLYIFGPDIISGFDHLAKEVRALEPRLTKKSVESWKMFRRVEILSKLKLKKLGTVNVQIVLPDEDVTRSVYEKFLKKAVVVFDPVFLRWDKHNSTAERPIDADQKISKEEFDKKIIRHLRELAEKRSSDWWRRIGALVIKNRKIILETYNKHVPSPHTPYANGDPRNNFHKGINIELSSVLHSEAGLVAEAARRGINLTGCSMYVSTFPCPPCAKLIAYSGISKLYYTGSYGVLDGESVLKSRGVEIIFVDTSDENKKAE